MIDQVRSLKKNISKSQVKEYGREQQGIHRWS
jgi:hypothetical protein